MNATGATITAILPRLSSIYAGPARGCRCGCKGTYAETPAAKAKRLRAMLAHVEAGAEVEIGQGYVDVIYETPAGYSRALTACLAHEAVR